VSFIGDLAKPDITNSQWTLKMAPHADEAIYDLADVHIAPQRSLTRSLDPLKLPHRLCKMLRLYRTLSKTPIHKLRSVCLHSFARFCDSCRSSAHYPCSRLTTRTLQCWASIRRPRDWESPCIEDCYSLDLRSNKKSCSFFGDNYIAKILIRCLSLQGKGFRYICILRLAR